MAALWSLTCLGLVALWTAASAAEYRLGRSNVDPRQDDPLVAGRVYDGSAADRVDDFMRRVPPGSVIRFDGQTFETCGVWDNFLSNQSRGFRFKSGWTLLGAGTNTAGGTVFKLVDVPVDASGLYQINAVFSTGGIGLYEMSRPPNRRPNVDQIAIRDLQIDCNYPELAKTKETPALQLAAIQLLGNRGITISNVFIRNAVSKKAHPAGKPFECFQVYLYNPWAANRPGDYHLDRIAIAEYQGGYTSAICVNGNAIGSIQNCSIDLASDRSQRYGLNFAAGIHDFVLASNVVLHAGRGINNDTAPVCTNVTLVSNRLVDCTVGMLLANLQNGRVQWNTITLDNRGGCGIALRAHPTMEHVKSAGCALIENTISGSAGEGITLAYQNEFVVKDNTLFWSTNNVIQGNVISLPLQNKIPPFSLASNTVRPGNRRHDTNYPACKNAGQPANQAALGFPSDIGLGSGCDYCPAKAVNTGYGHIARVRIEGTKLDMISNWGDGLGYSDFTTGYSVGMGLNKFKRNYEAEWADLSRGREYAMEVQAGGFRYPLPARFLVYIDLDHDGNFDPDRELVASQLSRTGLDRKITIPASAPLGSTRMRVIMGCGPEPGPCSANTFWGEVEDYTVTILP